MAEKPHIWKEIWIAEFMKLTGPQTNSKVSSPRHNVIKLSKKSKTVDNFRSRRKEACILHRNPISLSVNFSAETFSQETVG